MEILEAKNLTVWYEKNNNILEDINFILNTNKVYGLLGKNGSGKTTLINTICGVLPTFSGDIYINKLSVKEDNYKCRFQRFFISDIPQILSNMTSRQYINFILNTYKSSRENEEIEQVSIKYNFQKYLDYRMDSLSLGNKKKATIICALLLDVNILIFDEPLNGLDIEAIDTFIDDVINISHLGKCVIISSHLLDVMRKLTPNIIYIHDKSCDEIFLDKEDDIREVLSSYEHS